MFRESIDLNFTGWMLVTDKGFFTAKIEALPLGETVLLAPSLVAGNCRGAAGCEMSKKRVFGADSSRSVPSPAGKIFF